ALTAEFSVELIIICSDSAARSGATPRGRLGCARRSRGNRGRRTMRISSWVAAASAAFFVLVSAVAQPAQARDIVGFSGYPPGTVVVRTTERALYYVLGYGRAVRYPVGVGRAGKQWSGAAMITGKYLKPAWTPPDEVKRDKPDLPNVTPG